MKDKFYFDDLSKSFIGSVLVLNRNLELEIKLNKSQLNWLEVEQFVNDLIKEHFVKIVDNSKQILIEFIKLVPFGISEPIGAYDFKLEGIIYYGKVNNRIFSELVDSFELVFKLYHCNYVECYSPYVNYIVRVEKKLIMGVHYLV